MGPAIKIMLRGWAGSEPSAMTATAASTATQGWHTLGVTDRLPGGGPELAMLA
jgi:hypothetical protein